MTHSKFSKTPLVIAVAASVLLGACAAKKKEYVERPVESLYNEAMDSLLIRDYSEAINKFDEVERQHPYSQWSNKSQLMAAYTYYLANRYSDAIVSLERFIQLHPTSRDVPYAFYLKGLSYYEQISDVARDQQMTQLALSTLDELVKRYPKSKYARDAKVKLDLTHDHLAGKEMEIGRYYETQRRYLAAINRFKVVLEYYQTTTHVPEALHRLTEAYLAIGVEEEARRTAAVLGHNYPGSEWYVDTYALFGGADVPRGDVTAKGEKNGAKGKKPWYKFW